MAGDGPHQGGGLAHPARAVDQELGRGLLERREDAVKLQGPVGEELLGDHPVNPERVGSPGAGHGRSPLL